MEDPAPRASRAWFRADIGSIRFPLGCGMPNPCKSIPVHVGDYAGRTCFCIGVSLDAASRVARRGPANGGYLILIKTRAEGYWGISSFNLVFPSSHISVSLQFTTAHLGWHFISASCAKRRPSPHRDSICRYPSYTRLAATQMACFSSAVCVSRTGFLISSPSRN